MKTPRIAMKYKVTSSLFIVTSFLYFNQLFAQAQQLQQLMDQYGIPGIQLVCIKGKKEESVNLGTIGGNAQINISRQRQVHDPKV
jgi:hypothetical protein